MTSPESCGVDPRVAAEFPGLRLWSVSVTGVRCGRTPPEIRTRLAALADRMRGAEALALRARPVPHAYRVLFRQLGLDPDRTRTPLEQLVLERLLHGGATVRGMPDDAVALAVLETGVPVLALDGAAIHRELILRPAREGERVGGVAVPPGRLVVADARQAVAVLFGEVGPRPGRATNTVVLVAVQAPGVDALVVDEALWTAAEALPQV